MAKKPQTKLAHQKRIRLLSGGMVVSQQQLRRATANRQKLFDKDFQEQEKLRTQDATLMSAMYAPILDQYRKDARMVKSLQQLRARSATPAKQVLSPPRFVPMEPRIVADMGATLVPPYDFEEVIASQTGTPSNFLKAEKGPGKITSVLGADIDEPSSAKASVGVGFFFQPQTDCPGTLSISTTLAFTYFWSVSSSWASASTEGWVGLTVERFLDGFPDGMLVDQKTNLWSATASWMDSKSERGENTAFQLSAKCTVDRDHSYHIWVRCGGSMASTGTGDVFHRSGASSRIFGTVPSIAWELR